MTFHKFPSWPNILGLDAPTTAGSHAGRNGLKYLVLLASLWLAAMASAQPETRVCDPHQICKELPAGTYQSVNFVVPTNFTLPDGWEFRRDTRYQLAFGRAVDEPRTLDFLPVTLFVYKDVRALSQSCLEGAEPGVGLDAASIVEFWQSLPSVASSEPVPVTIAGLSGYMIDLAVDPDWTGTCPWSEGFPVAQLMYLPPPDTMHYGIYGPKDDYPGEFLREYVLDHEGGNIIFDLENPQNSPLGREEWLALVWSIIETFQFGGR